jgi:flagellar biosynthesis GTPase FlhF
MNTTPETKTFRGRSLEEVLPQVRDQLGPDAIVLRRREGLAGGVAGFFQRSYVEVEARGSLPDTRPDSPAGTGEPPLETRNDRATADGLSTPGVQALVQQASPFADALMTADRAHEVLAATAQETCQTPFLHEEPAPAGLYGPQPAYEPVPLPASAPDAAEPARTVPDTFLAPAAAAGLEAKLVSAGLSAPLAADLVGEAVAHGLPFSTPRSLKALVRTAIARRLPVLADLGPGARRIAFAGAGGAGKSAAVAALARAYAAADHEVVVVALRSPDGGCDLAAELEPHGVSVIAAEDAAQAARRLARRAPLLTLIDTPATGPGDKRAVAALAADLQALGATEIHLTLPATLSAAAADELAGALAPLGLTHVALTHADQTARPGAPVELAIGSRKPLSYVFDREGAEPADAAAVARRLLP